MIQRQRRPRRNRQQRIGFESLESRQVLTAAFVDVDPDMWAWDAGAAAESADTSADSWVASDGWYDESWWVADNWWNDEGSWSSDDGWVTASWSSDDAAVGIDVATAVVDGIVEDGTGLQPAITVDAGSTVPDGDGDSGWSDFLPEVIPGPEADFALETSVVSLEPRDVLVDLFIPADPSSGPVTDVLWGIVSEGLTDVTIATMTSETSTGDQDWAVIDAPSYEALLGSGDSAPAVLDDAILAAWDEQVAVLDEPVAVLDEPVAVLDEPVAVLDEPVAVLDEPVAVLDEPVAVLDEPVAVLDEPVAMVAPTTVLPRPPVVKTQGLAGRSTSWFGMFMPGFGGFSASSDAASLSDSEIPGRGRLRGRLPFRPAN